MFVHFLWFYYLSLQPAEQVVCIQVNYVVSKCSMKVTASSFY